MRVVTSSERVRKQPSGPTYVYCKCDCGAVDLVATKALLAGRCQMCGTCARGAKNVLRTHSFSGRPEYIAWSAMIRRCTDPNFINHERYKNITVCDEWRVEGGFERFLLEIGPRPGSGYSVDRIDNSRGYEPGNVRWATAKQQARNRKNTPVITINGLTRSVSEWAETAGVSYHTFRKRLDLGWSPQDAVSGVRSDKPVHRIRRDTPRYEIDGVTKTLHEWAVEAGVSASTFRARIEKLGWTPIEALSGARFDENSV